MLYDQSNRWAQDLANRAYDEPDKTLVTVDRNGYMTRVVCRSDGIAEMEMVHLETGIVGTGLIE